MTDRDYFAASALNALMVTAVEEEQWEICECAFAWADAMLEARDSRPAKPEATVDPDLRNNLRLCRDMVEQLRAEKAADWKAACEPVAWAVVPRVTDEIDCEFIYPQEATAGDVALGCGGVAVPLYRQTQTCPYVVGKTTLHCSLTPLTLTDEEREAICQAVTAYDGNDDDEECAKIAATLRSLLDRMK